jgi:hypothetical protein
VVHSGKESYPIGGDVMAMTLPDMMKKIRGPV